MADLFRKLRIGDKIPLGITVWNAILDVAKWYRKNKRNLESKAAQEVRQGSWVRIKNESGRNLGRYAVLGLDEPIFLPYDAADAFKRELTFRCVVPAAGSSGKFVVLIDPLRDGAIGRAYIDGATLVQVDIKDINHSCADVGAGITNNLVSSKHGTAQILWREKASDTPSTGIQWAAIRFGTSCGSSGGSAYCDCPEPSYTVEVSCGNCGPYYSHGTLMPKYWWLTVQSSTSTPYAYTDYCDDITCEAISGITMRLDYESDGGGYGGDACTWTGRGAGCVHVELTFDEAEDDWKLTIMDRDDCVLAVLRKDRASFVCCGENSNWINDDNNSCNMVVTIEPDPCTCCPDVSCPPSDDNLCKALKNCCLPETNCGIVVNLVNNFTSPCIPLPECIPPGADCGYLNGTMEMQWAGDCTWLFDGRLADDHGDETDIHCQAKLTLDDSSWTLDVNGPDGQFLHYSADWTDCAQTVTMFLKGGTCPISFTGPGDPQQQANFGLN